MIAREAKPRGKPSAYVDGDGYVYQTQRQLGWIALIFICAGFALLGALAMMNHFQIPYQALREPLPTAGVATRTPVPAGGLPGNDAQRVSAPAPAYEQDIATYNEQQEERAAAFDLQATQEAPSAAGAMPVDKEAAIEAWLAAPVSTATPTRGVSEIASDTAAVVMDAAFDASFQEAPSCSPFIGYIGQDKARCDAFFLEQTATAGE
jgi:hypothetical protein